MASTDDYIKAIEDKREKGETATVDFSKMPADVDQEKIRDALSKGLPDDYSKAIQDRFQNKSPISLNYGIIHVKQSVPEKVWDTIKEPVMASLKNLSNPKTVARGAVEATGVPERGLQAIGVGAEKMLTGDRGNLTSVEGLKERGQEALASGAEATKEGYTPKPGEKIGSTVAQFGDPRFMGLAEVGGGLAPEVAGAAGPYVKAAASGAFGMAGENAAEQFGSTGKVDPTQVAKSAGVGAVAGPVFHAAMQVLSPILGPLAEKMLSKPTETGKSVIQGMAEGKPIAQVAKELGVSEEAAQKALDAVKGAQETSAGLAKKELPVIQPGSKTGEPHALFAYNDKFGEGGKERSLYNIFGDPQHPKIKQRGWGSSLTKEQLGDIPITGKEPRAAKLEPISSEGASGSGITGSEGPGTSASTQSPSAQPGASGAPYQSRIFPAPSDPSLKDITLHPDFVKTTKEAESVIQKYAKSRNIPASPEFAESIFQELHDKVHAVSLAPPGDRARVAKEIMEKYPNISDDFKTLALNRGSRLQQGFFDAHIRSNKPPIPSEPIDNSNHAIVSKALEGDPPSVIQAMKQAYEKFTANHKELVNNVGEIIGYQLNPSEASSAAHNLFDRRFGDIGLGHFESQLFRRDATRGLSDIERQAIPFVIEGKIPQLDRFQHPDAAAILEAAKNPSDAMKLAVAKIGPYYKEGHEFISQVKADIGFRENYVNRIWKKGDAPGPAIGASKQSLSEWNPFSNRRYIGSLAEGINMGKTPETTDIDHLLRIYDDFKIKTVANAKFVEQLHDLDVLKTPEKAPSDWVKLSGDKYKTLQRKVFIPGKEKGDPGFFMYRPMAVHPDYLPAIDAIVSKPFSNDAIRGLELFNAAYKKSLFSFSLFHHFTLGTVDIAAGGNPFKMIGETIAKRFAEAGESNPFKYLFGEEGALNRKNLYKSFMDGHAAFDNIPVAKDAIRHGLNVNPLSDAQVGRIRNAFANLEERVKSTPVVGTIAKAANTYDKVFDKGLWDYMHAGVKMDLYQRHLEQNLKAFPDMPIEAVKRQTAEFVNNAAGGALDGMILNPKFQQTMHWAMMAPDFFLTRLNTFASMFKGGPVGFQARKMWLKAAVAYYSAANVINFVNTKKAYGQGQYLWENDKDHQLTPFLEKIPNGPQAGRQQFLKLDKALTEPIEFLMNPKKVLGNKFSPYANAMAVYWTGRTMSGFKPQEEGPMDFLKQSIPMSLRGQSVYGVFPKVSGMSKTTIATEFAKAFDNKDEKKMQELARIAAQNGYNPNHLKQAVRRILVDEKKKAMQNQ